MTSPSPVASSVEGSTAASGLGLPQNGGWKIVPYVSAEETYTDNVDLSTQGKSDWITTISPGIHVDGTGARVNGSLDYHWAQSNYVNESDRRNLQRSMNGSGQVELVENWLFLEGSGNISQQTVSAFGTQSSNNELINSNRTETSTYKLSPRIQGLLGSVASYQLRYDATTTNSKASALPKTTSGEWSGTLKGVTPLTSLSWAIVGDRQHIEYNAVNARPNTSELARGVLTYSFDPQIKASLIAGRESNDYGSLDMVGKNIYGIGLDWAITERTQLSMNKERRFFGDGHSLTFSHRTPLSAWNFSDIRDVSTPSQQMAQIGLGSIYDLFFAQLTSSIPDPFARAQAVSQILQKSGIPANTQVSAGFLTSRVTISRSQVASVALMGANNTVTFSAQSTQSQQLGTSFGVIDDLSLSSSIKQKGLNVNWAHQLSELTYLTLLASHTHSTGLNSSSGLDSSLNSLLLSLTTQIGSKTSANFGLRHVRSASTAGNSYDENAVTGAVSFKF